MPLLAFFLARAKEPSTYAGLAMLLTAAGIHYSAAEFNAAVNLLIALAGAVAVIVPENARRKSGLSRVLVPILLTGAVASLATACSSSTVAANAAATAGKAKNLLATANADIAALKPVFATLCAGGAWADAQFHTVASVASIDAGTLADEAKAASALAALCAASPGNVATAIASATALYRQITAATPVVPPPVQANP